MSGYRQYSFTHASGEDIYLFTLRNANNTEVSITNYGAIITSFKTPQADGSLNDIVLGFDKVQDYLAEDYLLHYPWFGAAVGRYANRISNSRFQLNGKAYQLSSNNGKDHLHGGKNGFDKKVWKVDSFLHGPYPSLVMDLKSPDGDEGYPGNLDVRIRFELTDDNELSIEYAAHTDRSTPVNLTHHGYFNLNNGKGTIANHLLKIYSSLLLEQNENLVVTGAFKAVEGTPYDFKDFHAIGSRWDPGKGYDQSFVLDKTNTRLSLAAEVQSRESGLKLQVYTNEPVIHFYSGIWIPLVKGKSGREYAPFSGFCLETHKHPNAVNIPQFPNTILDPGERYYQKTIYKLIT